MLEKLLDSTKEIILSLQRQTGYEVQLVPNTGDSAYSGLVYACKKNGGGGHIVIGYNPESQSIDYAVALGGLRFKRFLRAPPDKRVLMMSDPETREHAYGIMEQDIAGKQGVLRATIRKGFDHFFDALLLQLATTPGDFWTNERLYQEYPELRGEQRIGLDELFRRAHISYASEVEAVTPLSAYESSHSMFAALAIYVDGLLHTTRYSQPYRNRGFQKVGKQLHDMNLKDKGYIGDMAVINAWAERLDLKGWFRWKQAEGPS